MSDFPGDITKQILSAPPRIIRSSRYSETAQGRSTPSSVLLPTGSNSLENANGWIRLPRPAAGMMPHISSLLGNPNARRRAGRAFEQFDQFTCAPARAMLVQRTLARASRQRRQFVVTGSERCDDVRRTFGMNDFVAGLEERIEPFPDIADNRRAARCGLEQATGWTPAHLGHRTSDELQVQP